MPTVSKRKTDAITGAGALAFIGVEGCACNTSLSRTISIIRIIKGR